jgi:signal transduction histidine kinase
MAQRRGREHGDEEQAADSALVAETVSGARALADLAAAGNGAMPRVERLLDGASDRSPEARALVVRAIGLLALRDPARALLGSDDAVRAQLRVLSALGPLREICLWAKDDSGRALCSGHVRGRPSSAVRTAARRVLAGGGPTPAGPRRAVIAAPVGPRANPLGALTARVPAGYASQGLELLAEAAPLLAGVLERRELVNHGEREAMLIAAASERRLKRFGFDLHDGAAQEAAALLSDLRLFAGQLDDALAGDSRRSLIGGRVQDIEARAIALQHEIRSLARAAQGAAIQEPMSDLLEGEGQAFSRATGLRPRVSVRGPVDAATPSQRIALVRGIQEALRNVRQHAEASEVSVTVVARADRITAEVRDDGRGFVVKQELARAAREGRLGLVGMLERARLLGGRCDISSRPGGPTVIAMTVPRWEPEQAVGLG